ncbi:MAG: hypothetical protein HOC27_04040 [Phycisphaerae bacterium]|jgi:hypothetical protein|nr:hypothetical protein [Phycisphaerae bacterium]
MKRRGLSLLEMTLAIGLTAIIGAAIAAMMAAATNSLTSKDDGRQSSIRLATTQVRLGAYIAPSRCIVDKNNSHITLWHEDSTESKTINASEIRWIQFNEENKLLAVKFIVFPEEWSDSMIDSYDTECDSDTDYESLLYSFEDEGLVESIPLVDAIASCNFWMNETEPFEATHVSIRFSLESTFGITHDAVIDESIRLHQPPTEQP